LGKDKTRPNLTPEEVDEFLTFVENSGYDASQSNYIEEDTHYHRLYIGQGRISYPHTNKLTALVDLARNMDPENYGKRGYYKLRSILDKEGISKLKTRIMERAKECLLNEGYLHSDGSMNERGTLSQECDIVPLRQRELPQ
jgi:hypothetical protein